jgi:hypothetical protein
MKEANGAVGGTAEFRVPKEPKRTDFFAAIQTGQAKLSNTRNAAAVTVLTLNIGFIMEQSPAQINLRFCYRLRAFKG